MLIVRKILIFIWPFILLLAAICYGVGVAGTNGLTIPW